MFKRACEVDGFVLCAQDGEVGHVTDLYFDDEQWTVRYLVIGTGPWFFGRRVLISPNAVSGIDWDERKVRVTLTMQQVRESPDIDTDRPISREQESEYHLYYNFPPYWGGVALWGRYAQPGGELSDEDLAEHERTKQEEKGKENHLRSAREVRGYRVMAIDGEVGHVDDFLMDPTTWAIRYLAVNTGSWLKKHEVVITRKLVDQVVWAQAQMNVNASKALIESAPDYHRDTGIDRALEARIFEHFTTHPYWSEAQE